jgi:hypothetical protein
MESSEALTAEMQLASRIKHGANWFFWIAGLSLANSVILLAGGKWSFVVGLGVTQLVDLTALFAKKDFGHATLVNAIALGVNAFVAGFFILFGVFARKRYIAPFVVGMVLYVIDGVVLALFEEWLSVVFHALVLWWLFGGLRACRGLARETTGLTQ